MNAAEVHPLPVPNETAMADFLAVSVRSDIHLVVIPPDDGPLPFGCWFGDDASKAAAWAAVENRKGHGVYWTVNHVRPGFHKKPSKADMIGARFCHVDIDPPKDGRPWDRAGALERLGAMEVPPTFVIDSGGGLQAFWRFDEAGGNLPAVERLNKRLAALHGGDHCHNIDRLMRVPGSVNWPDERKRRRGRIPSLATVAIADQGEVVEPEALHATLPPVPDVEQPQRERVQVDGVQPVGLDQLKLTTLDPLHKAITCDDEAGRSERVLKVAGLMVRAGYDDATICGILLNPDLPVSGHCLDQPSPMRAAVRAIGRARGDAKAEQSTGDAGAAPEEWPEPVDLWQHYSAPELPVGLLPDVIERFARRHCEVMGADPAGLAMAALVICATAISDDIAIQVKRNDPTWRESARLWVGLVGPPSRKKTPILKAALRPLRRLDGNLMASYLEAKREHDALTAEQRKTASPPKQKRLMISDATIEAAQEVMKDSPDGILSEQDELSGWFGSMDKYAPGKGAQADRAFWLKAFNGGTYNLNRVSRGAVQIPNLSINLLGGIQPEPLRKIANDTVDDGLIQRLLPVILRPASVGRDVPGDGVVLEYERLIEKLYLMKPPQRAIGGGDSFGAPPVRFDDRARAVRERLEVEHLGLVEALETVSPKLAAHYGKFDGLFARLCLLWHCIDNADAIHPPAEISAATAERVAKFMEQFIRPSAVAFYAGMLGISAGHEELVALASWLIAKGLDEVVARDAQRSTQSLRHLTADDVRLLCEKLDSFGWLVRGEPAPKSNTPRWIVNPRVHVQFGERARIEQDRRNAARDALRHALAA